MENTPDFKLSPDMVMHVLQRLDPVDILAMRAVGRRLFSELVRTSTHRWDLDMSLLLSNSSF